jgi:hypothetical protein
MELIRIHSHRDIVHEIRRELVNSKCRDVEDGSSISMDFNFDD